MDESLNDALRAVGEKLAEAMRLGLAEQGLPDKVSVLLVDEKVIVASDAAAVREAEMGTLASQPRGIMEGIVHDATPALWGVLAAKLQDKWS